MDLEQVIVSQRQKKGPSAFLALSVCRSTSGRPTCEQGWLRIRWLRRNQVEKLCKYDHGRKRHERERYFLDGRKRRWRQKLSPDHCSFRSARSKASKAWLQHMQTHPTLPLLMVEDGCFRDSIGVELMKRGRGRGGRVLEDGGCGDVG